LVANYASRSQHHEMTGRPFPQIDLRRSPLSA
jgi:hypothetical protein